MAISANDVKTLRDRTNAPMMNARPLNETGGDMEKAVDWLRKKAAARSVPLRRAKPPRGASPSISMRHQVRGHRRGALRDRAGRQRPVHPAANEIAKQSR